MLFGLAAWNLRNTLRTLSINLSTPTHTELRSFLGLYKVFSRFVLNGTRLIGPFDEKLRKDQPKTFGPLNEMQRVEVPSLKETLISP